MEPNDSYDGREQSRIKHIILGKYLDRFAHIIGNPRGWSSITYVDCFSGPWQSQTNDQQDTSFGVALKILRKTRDDYEKASEKSLRIRCFFLERNKDSYKALEDFAKTNADVEIRTINKDLEDAIEDILAFVDEDRATFPFFFIDPKGWTGYALDKIGPLLRHDPGEVLINFMTHHIQRFVNDQREGNVQSFEELFGYSDYLADIKKISEKVGREEAIVQTYMNRLRSKGNFEYVANAFVFHRLKSQTHYNLIYATRNRKGLTEFKECEKRSMNEAERIRIATKQSERTASGQDELFEDKELFTSSTHYGRIREKCVRSGYSELDRLLRTRKNITYELAYDMALQRPLFWESDLKNWIEEREKTNRLILEGLKGKERKPKLNSGHTLTLQDL